MPTFKEEFRADQLLKDGEAYYDLQMICEEKTEEFIFTILNNFASEHYGMSIDKNELVAAIQLIRMYKEQGVNIYEQRAGAYESSKMLKERYEKGYLDGQKDILAEITELLKKENEDE